MLLVDRIVGEPEKTPDQEAVRWFLRLRQGKLNPSERQDFRTWHATPAHAEAFTRAKRLWHAVDEVSARPELLRLRETILTRLGRRRLYVSAAVAACVAVIVICGAVLAGLLRPTHDSLRIVRALMPAAKERTFTTAVGERSTVTLRDGSILTLNTDSAAIVDYSAAQRAVKLVRGQALFEVAKGEPRPFVVYAGDRRIVATGTAFDVRLAGSEVEVTLVEGHVHVDQTTGAVGSGAQNELQPGERLVAVSGAPVSITPANVERVTSWTSGKLVFRDTRLADAVAEANRYAYTPITLADAGLGELRVNGVFRSGQPEELARAVALILPVTVDYKTKGQIRLVPKAE